MIALPVDITHPTTNQTMTNQLFFENYKDNDKAIFTLKDKDFVDPKGTLYPSLKKLYLESDDPTEYVFAKTVFGSWKIWKKVRSCKLVKELIDDWKEELEIKMRSQAQLKIVEISNSKSPNAMQAAKYVDQEIFKRHQRGHPSKEEVQGHLNKEAKVATRVSDDMKRLGLTTISGGKN